jgi:type I restriction enzyme S subunit
MDIIKPAAREGQGIDKVLLLNKVIYIPPKSVWVKFQVLYSCLKDTIQSKTKESETLINIRDNLLPKLMTGEIRVPVDIPGKEAD